MATKQPELVTDEVCSHLRDMILNNVLPAGQKLVDRDLAEQLGVSRTPVRDALGRLAVMGLVENRIRRGYYVRKFSTKQVSDLYDFRKMLEVHAVKLAVQNALPSHLHEFDRILVDLETLTSDPADHTKAVKLDLEIHKLIARASGNESLHMAMQNVLDKVTCFIWVETAENDALGAAHREHRALLRLIKEKDVERAAELVGMHVESAKKSLVKVFEARDTLRNAVLAATPSNRRTSQRRESDIEIKRGERS